MPADVLVDTGLACHRPDVALHEIVRPVGLSALHGWTSEDVVGRHRVWTLATPAQKILRHVAVPWGQVWPRLLSCSRPKVTLIGFLGADAEVRTNDNRSVTTPSLATKSSYKKDGKYISHTEWHRCVVFGKLSEFAGTLKKGAHLHVEGELRSREYETKKVGRKAAQKKTLWEIRVNSILKLDRAEKAAQEVDSSPDMGAAA